MSDLAIACMFWSAGFTALFVGVRASWRGRWGLGALTRVTVRALRGAAMRARYWRKAPKGWERAGGPTP